MTRISTNSDIINQNIEELKLELEKTIIKNNFNLITPDVVSLSQMLDTEIVKEQKKKAALQSNPKKKFIINIIAKESEVV
ncbi:aspartyl-phosphate phosphatase Spo0E family protein [Clostridium tagluense]|uniref:aspartyl-phosphate phosphatase Spo0E family protein n=1 Tax=Clostridium tagluense TaxID=360422 RepID=UPI001CF4254D|nr:aspartyl-phosphate phosphatase Spo0E family protein [Clostridium tagluense]MCB2310682.1 aspartyl-phosphate phosphatase Spo0E family protein [Clostridium tagluense]MCB2315588.1 aspartyl-phosphate phosphatase Spo0E family protein [Clostridium tagluense]MCB2320442.1 aspartyl-phosphate phosphatase Spo0E family protein [Clostridium tagluense]MCB2325275.1 aspartyl-phosphate phosphatase Spo0E family protein [Clostridium tagluense]MCB2330127.1 aspartyl-phosphate phosphatase Spo0E family protein [Cl